LGHCEISKDLSVHLSTMNLPNTNLSVSQGMDLFQGHNSFSSTAAMEYMSFDHAASGIGPHDDKDNLTSSVTSSLFTPTVGLSASISPVLPTSMTNFTTRSAKDIAAEILRSQIPEELLQMSSDSRNCVIAYVILFLIGAPGNLSIFITVGREIWRRQLMRSRIKVLIWHLATADLLVCFVVIPIEVFWRITVQWYGGDALCRISQFFRAFGLYLSSMVIICISLDRFFAIVFPLKVIGGMKRVRNMLWIAWCSAILFATPQVMIP